MWTWLTLRSMQAGNDVCDADDADHERPAQARDSQDAYTHAKVGT